MPAPDSFPTIPISAEQIAQLSELARLQIPADQQDALRSKLQELVQAFARLAEADLGETGGPVRTDGADDLRADACEEAMPGTDQVLANAPRSAADSFVVPRVLDI